MIEHDITYRPTVPRETRRLLVAALIALVTLWALARVRFPDRPIAPNPVTPLLSQFRPSPRFGDLASQVAAIYPRLVAAMDPAGHAGITALHIGDGLSISLAALDRIESAGLVVQRSDRVNGLVVLAQAGDAASTRVSTWSPDQLNQPRYLFTATADRDRLHLSPLLITALVPITNPLWADATWRAVSAAPLPPNAFLFTEDGQFVGAVSARAGTPLVIPAATLLANVERLVANEPREPGTIGAAIAPLTAPLTRATGATTGVVVAWVDPRGASRGALHVGDVIEQVNGRAVTTLLEWESQARAFDNQQAITLRVHRSTESKDVSITARPFASAPSPVTRVLGLDLRRVADGSRIANVVAGSVGESAGLRVGDIIVHAGDTANPAPAVIRRLFVASSHDRPMLIAIDRNGTHQILTLEADVADRP